MKHLFPIYGMCSILWLGACTPVATQPEKSLFTTQEDFPNLLNVKNVPEQSVDGISICSLIWVHGVAMHCQ